MLISAVLRDRLSRGPPELYEEVVRREVERLTALYHRGTPPLLVAQAAATVYRGVCDLRRNPSVERARLRGLIGRMLVAAGADRGSLAMAEDHLVGAKEELERTADWTRETVGAYVDLALNHAVSLKARGQSSAGITVLRSTVGDRALRRYTVEPDLMPLIRQDVMMDRSVRAHETLAEKAVEHKDANDLDYYRSVKRLFEFALNRRDVRSADRLYDELTRAYRRVAFDTPPIARVSFVKNCGQYRALARDRDGALALLAIARSAAEQNELAGQTRQIDRLAEAVQLGEPPFLETFKAA
jgi:hypothetical protein